MEQKRLKVQMLGAFIMEYDHHPIAFERNTMTKTNQLMQILLFAGENGIKREQLMQQLFGREEVTNPSNSLRATVFRLRKLLAEAGLPSDDEFVHIKSGTYRFSPDIPVELDVVLFEELAERAFAETEEEKCIALLEEACRLYQGDFLPQLENVEWVGNLVKHYKNLYVRCMTKLCELLKERKEYQKLYQVAAGAVALYPFDEWQVWQIDSLIAQNQMNEAMRLYDETADALFRGNGALPSKLMQERLAKMNSDVEHKAERIDKIQDILKETDEQDGAFYCSYPSFAETYRFMERVIKRSGQPAYLMLCTITDGKGYPLDKSERLEKLAEELDTAIRNALRRGDLFTKYSANQFLILLLDIKQEDCLTVIDRINNSFENPSRKNYLKYHIAPINETEDEEK